MAGWILVAEETRKRMCNKPDWILVVLSTLLVATLAAYFTGVFPYPFGGLILLGLLAYRVIGLEKKSGDS